MLSRLRTYASFVRFSHSVFALPFALVGMVLAARTEGFVWSRLIWIVGCMVSARSAAMGFNRLVDAGYDARNPRTASREIPAGRMNQTEAQVFVAVSSVVFIACTYPLGGICFALSPVALAIVFWYSLAKRVTSYTQAFLGLAMAVAPVGGWLAAGGGASLEPWLLGLAIGCWVGGFDILYACQDVEFDRREGLHSIPTRFGVARDSDFRLLHVATRFLRWRRWTARVARPVWRRCRSWSRSARMGTILVRADDLSQVKRAFDMNGWVGVLYSGDDRGGGTGDDRTTDCGGVTGASGAIYAARTIAALLEAGCDLELVFRLASACCSTSSARTPKRSACGNAGARYGDGVGRGTFVIHSNKDLGASLASGSHRCEAMVIVPCPR